jgi:hypothetical protein
MGLWGFSIPLFLLLWYYPVIDYRVRVMTFCVGLWVVAGSVLVTWKTKGIRWFLITIYGLVAVFLLLPSTIPENRENLRTNYCSALESYTGRPYVWGGEGYFGIDCSGFVRKGFEDALVKQGFLHFDPAMVRSGIWLYWHDTTAKVIGEAYGGRTYPVTTCSSLNALDYSLVLPGDLAVTEDGTHIMAYLGDQTWIAADPFEEKVTEFKIPEKKNVYFSTPMKIMRWTLLKP